jgi:hypothetical protein
VIGRDTISERVRPAGIFRDIPADRACTLTGRIRSVKILRTLYCQGHVEVDDPWLHDGALIVQVKLGDAIHARKGNHHATRAWDGPTAQAGAGAAAHHRHTVFLHQLRNRRDFLGVPWENDSVGPGLIHSAVIFVKAAILLIQQYACGAEQVDQAFFQPGRDHSISFMEAITLGFVHSIGPIYFSSTLPFEPMM